MHELLCVTGRGSGGFAHPLSSGFYFTEDGSNAVSREKEVRKAKSCKGGERTVLMG